MSEQLLLLGIILNAVSGLLGVPFRKDSMKGQWVAAFLAVVGSAIGLAGVGRFWITGESQPIEAHWPILDAQIGVGIDGLSAFFLTPIFLISLLGNIYGLGYWKQTEYPGNGQKLRVFYGALTAGMAVLVIARDSILFLVGWEIMALSAFFLVTTEDEDGEVRTTGWIYLAASHVATLCLLALFALLRAAGGSFTFVPMDSETCPTGLATAIFILALLGFGIKAGVMPGHVWLPGAHANAPSHVSAIMSGVLIKMGIYGLVRIMSLFPHPPMSWAAIVLVLGAVSGVLGVAFALGQHDLKRLLAYHSIENIGIIAIGIGLALLGRSQGKVEWIILGMTGGLLHVWNHALFKSLLFFSAGSVIHTAHTREFDHLGGLAKRMPWTALAFLVGAVAICGLPPLNGFVSEFLIYLGMFRTLGEGAGLGSPGTTQLAGAALAAPALALIGALAVACFVKVYGVAFLGNARSEEANHSEECSPLMLGPMAVLVICCFLIGLAPLLIVPILVQGVSAWSPEILAPAGVSSRLVELAPLNWITTMGLLLIAGLAIAGAMLRMRLPHTVVENAPTWGCGYPTPTPRMQYTASSFAQMIVGLFAWALRGRSERPAILALFPGPSRFHSEVPDTALDEAVLPAFRWGAWLFSAFRVFQRGSIQAYVLYIFIVLLALLMW
jgi:hydrogenase-4 component B